MKINIRITREENADYFHSSIGSTVKVELEEYVAAVVASELASSGLEAMKAQAVAARTFAVALGVLDGKTISDSSATAQAYRAARYDEKKYPRCIFVANETAGMILTYKGKVINAVYSDSNGGRTVSAQSRWGGSRPYLIEKDDPYDRKATNGNKRGHGVGMSQQGAKQMAMEGKGFKEILAFYYPGTELCIIEGAEVKEMASKDMTNTRLIELFYQAYHEGWGYIWGTHGQLWTEARQKAAMNEMAVKYGSKWIGKRVSDCSGLFYWAFSEMGGYIYHGSNTIWNKYCTAKGELKSGIRTDGQVLKPGTAVFTYNSSTSKRGHIGLYVGGGIVIEAAGTIAGVVTSSISNKKWVEWGELKGISYVAIDDTWKPEEAEIARPTLSKGANGDDVTLLQNLLNNAGYDCGTADGKFGAKTQAAVKSFQSANGLTADGVVGRKTWAKLNELINFEEEPEVQEEAEIPEKPKAEDKKADEPALPAKDEEKEGQEMTEEERHQKAVENFLAFAKMTDKGTIQLEMDEETAWRVWLALTQVFIV